MKKIFTCLAMLLCTGYAMAADDKVSIPDVEVPQGGTANLVVKYNVASNNRMACSVLMQFPEETDGSSLLSLKRLPDHENPDKPGEMEPGDWENTFASGILGFNFFNLEEAGVGFLVMALNNYLPVPGDDDAELLTLTLCADKNAEIGHEYTVTVSKSFFEYKTNGEIKDGDELDPFTFKVTIVDPRVILDEESVTAPEAANGVDIRVKRTINANTWSTICLPLAMDADQVQETFGEGTQLGDFTGCVEEYDGEDLTGIYVKFAEATAIAANHPYIIKVPAAITEFELDNVNVTPSDELSVDCDKTTMKIGGKNYTFYNSFVGTYEAGTVLDENKLFLSGGKFWYATTAAPVTMKAFRAYFDFINVLPEVADARAFITIGDETTSINNVIREVNDGEYYDLQGRRVINPSKGFYIQNGKKVFVK